MNRFLISGFVPVLLLSQAPAGQSSQDLIQDEAGLVRAMNQEFNLDIRLYRPIRISEEGEPALVVSLLYVRGMLTDDEFFDRYWRVVGRYKEISKVKRVIITVILPIVGGELGSAREWRVDGSGAWNRQPIKKG